MLSENTYFEDQTCFYIFKNKKLFLRAATKYSLNFPNNLDQNVTY